MVTKRLKPFVGPQQLWTTGWVNPGEKWIIVTIITILFFRSKSSSITCTGNSVVTGYLTEPFWHISSYLAERFQHIWTYLPV